MLTAVLVLVAALIFERSIKQIENAAIVQAIVTLAHNLNMRVIGEGIECMEQLVQLQTLSCDCGQGYYFSKPVPPEQTAALLATTSWVRQSA